MKSTKLLMLLFSIALFSCNSSYDKKSFDQFSWIENTWKCQSENTVFYEKWQKVNDHTIKCINFNICNGQITENDSSFIELKDDKIEFRSGKSKWIIESVFENSFRFANHDFGEEIKYVFDKKDGAKVQLTFPNKNVSYSMTKIDLQTYLKKVNLEGDYYGTADLNGKPALFSLSFVNTDGVTNAFMTTADSAIVHEQATSCCINSSNSILNFANNSSHFAIQFDIINNQLKGFLISDNKFPFTLEKSNSVPTKSTSITNTFFQTSPNKISCSVVKPSSGNIKNSILIIGEPSINGLDGYNEFAYRAAAKGIAVYSYKQNYFSGAKSYYEALYIDFDKAAKEAEEVISAIKSENNSITIMAFGIGNFVADQLINKNVSVKNIIAISPPCTSFQSLITTESLRNLYMRNTITESAEACKEVWNAIYVYLSTGKEGLQVQKAIDNAWQEGWGSYSLPQELPNEATLKKFPLAKNLNSNFILNRSNFNIPIIAIFGEKDVVMNVKENAEAINQQFADKKSLLQIRIYGNADHNLESNNTQGTSFTKSFSNELYNDLWKLFK